VRNVCLVLSFFSMCGNMNINQVVIPAAGLGTRFLPWTNSVPKELIPLGNIPAIEYVVREALDSGCSNIVMISGARKNAINDYFEKCNLPATFSYIPQLKPKGVGHAIALAEPVIKDDYFGVMFPDDLFFGKEPGLGQLIEIAKKEKATVVAVIEVPWDEISRYGAVRIKKQINDRLFEISGVVEKPKTGEAPSNLILPGRYVFSAKIFESLKCIGVSPRGEIELTDAITDLAQKGERVLAYKIDGFRYDVGTPINWIQAIIALSLDSKEYEPVVRQFIKKEFIRRYGKGDFLN